MNGVILDPFRQSIRWNSKLMRMVSVVVKPAKDSNHPGAQELCSKAASKTIGAKPPKQQKP